MGVVRKVDGFLQGNGRSKRLEKSSNGNNVKVSSVTIKACSDHAESQLKV